MLEESRLSIELLGVRGSFTTPGESTLRYGGRTSCVLVRAGNQPLLFDAGSGLFNAIPRLQKEPSPVPVLLSHTHLDHIIGLPAFLPATPNLQLDFYAGHLPAEKTLSGILGQIMTPELFPLPLENFANRCRYHQFIAGQTLAPAADLIIETLALCHPGGAVGYRLNYADKSFCYITDHEMGQASIDAALENFVRHADMVVFDATYRETELEKHRGWGHSAAEQVLALASRAGVKKPILSHHDPARTDAALDALAIEAKQMHKGAEMAREGACYDLGQQN